MTYGIDYVSGFNLKRLQNILEDYKAQYNALYGNPNLDSGVIANRIQLESNMLASIWEGMQLAYNAPFASLTDDGSLPNVMAINGLTLLPATATSILCDCVFTNAGTIPAGALIVNEAGSVFSAIADIIATGSETVEGYFNAVVTGAVAMPSSGTLTIQTPYTNWDSVSVHGNVDSSVVVGRDVETLAQARVRRLNSLLISGSATLAAIASAVKNNANIPFCTAIDWTTDPSISFGYLEVIVQSNYADPVGTPNAAERLAIANQIWQKRSAGIGMQGAISQNITDSTGRTQTIKFSYVQDVNIRVFVNYSLFLEDGNTAPTDISAAINLAVSNVFAAQSIGEDLIYYRVIGACASVPGIKINSLSLSAEHSAPVTTDISISSFYIAKLDTVIITVT